MKEGKILLNDIDFTDIAEKKVVRNNTTSGKITLPVNLIGKKVIVIFPKEKQ